MWDDKDRRIKEGRDKVEEVEVETTVCCHGHIRKSRDRV